MSTKRKLLVMMVTIALMAMACGQLRVGIESTPEYPSPAPPTRTASTESLSGNLKDAADKNPLPTQTLESNLLPESETGRLDCSGFNSDALITTACNVQAAFISRNTSTLLNKMPQEFALGYWQSEWTTVTPEYALESFQRNMLPPNPDQMTFTTDHEQFPPLFGTPVDQLLGPDLEVALVIYSEGWGQDGLGAALIFITGNETSGYQFPAFLIANKHFDKPEAGRLDCRDFGTDALTTIACNLQDSLISRNTSPLLSYMPPEFAIGYWLSEWTTVTPEYALDLIQNHMLPANPEEMTFTADPEQFPQLYRPIATMLGPEEEVALVIYSEGCCEEGKGAAIFFITGNETIGYQFKAMLVSGNHFELAPGSGDAN